MKNPLSVRLEPPELERSFRITALGADVPRVLMLLAIGSVFTVIFSLTDNLFVVDRSTRLGLIFARGFAVLCLLVGMWVLHARRTVRTIELTALVTAMAFAFHMLLVAYLAPYSMPAILVWDVLVLFTFYTMLPVPLGAQLPAALLLTFGAGFIWLPRAGDSLSPIDHTSLLAAFVYVNAVGVLTSLQLAAARRRRFAGRVQELRERVDLEYAMSEIRVLKEIVPICMHCRNVRNDSGYWERLESYVGSRSEADFSHSLCPDCLSKHYPEYAGDAEQENA